MNSQKLSNNSIFSFVNVSVLNENKLALKNINVNFYGGKVYSIFGEHGSGKTTFCKTIIGESRPVEGSLHFNGKELKKYNLRKSKQYGLLKVDQHILCPENLSISDYFFLTDLHFSNWLHNRSRRNEQKVRDFLLSYNIDLNPEELISSLSFQQKVIVDIFQKIYLKPKLLILDETIEKLSQEYKEIVFSTIRSLKAEGNAVLLVTHDIHEAHELSDRILIMRNGEIIFRDSIKSIDDISIIRMAYTQTLNISDTADTNTNFYSLLKFNQAILEQLPIPLMVIDENNIVRISNSYAQKLIAIPELNNKNITELMSENPKIAELIIEMIKEDNVCSRQHLSMNTGDTFRIINITICPVMDNTVKIGNLIFIDDVSEHEFLRQQIIQSDKYASLGIFTSGIAHEINNPLEIIINCLDYLNINIDNYDFRKKIHYIEEEIDRISGIIKNLNSYTQPGERVSRVNISRLLSEMIDLLKPHSRAHNTILKYYPENENVFININSGEIKQVLLNIVKNSIDAIEDDGEIKIFDKIERTDDKDNLLIVVEDNGIGIPDSESKDVFLPFYSTKNQENMGLGLYISYQIINKYKGTISFEKIEPNGTRCIIKLPAETNTN